MVTIPIVLTSPPELDWSRPMRKAQTREQNGLDGHRSRASETPLGALKPHEGDADLAEAVRDKLWPISA